MSALHEDFACCPFCGEALGLQAVRLGVCSHCRAELGKGPDTWEMPEAESENWPRALHPSSTMGSVLPGRLQGAIDNIRGLERGPDVSEDCDFSLLEQLGKGGMGLVYAARQVSLDRDVAVKLLRTDKQGSHSARAKFLAEAQVTGELEHPNIVPVYELGATKDGIPFYAMKQVKGQPWSRTISGAARAANLEIWMRVADAVAYAHSCGVIHRDIKPENVMLGDYGEVVLMDWGLAVSITNENHAPHIESLPAVGGTPGYMAPEMARGETGLIGYSSDVYLLGAVLFEIVTGCAPHPGEAVSDIIQAARNNEIVVGPQNEPLLAIARTAMASRPGDRYASVKLLQGAIREYQAHQESIELTQRAKADLAVASRSDRYDDFSKAMFAYQEAAALWEGNAAAREGDADTRLMYARCAAEKGDLELAESLLIVDDPDHANCLETVMKMRAVREEQRHRQAFLSVALRGMIAFVILALTIGVVLIRGEKERAVNAELSARDAEQTARGAKDKIEKALLDTRAAQADAESARLAAEEAQRAEAAQRLEAESDKELALAAKFAAEQAQVREKEERVRSEQLLERAERERARTEAALKDADAARISAERAREQAEGARIAAELAQEQERSSRERAERERTRAEQALSEAEVARTRAIAARNQMELAIRDRDSAELAAASAREDLEVAHIEARQAKVRAAAQHYKNEIADYANTLALARAHIGEQALRDAERLLESCPVEHRNWEWGRLFALTQPRMTAFEGHTDTITALAISPDAETLLVGDQSGKVVAWSIPSGLPLRSVQQHHGAVLDVRFAAADLAVSVDQTGHWRQWGVQSGGVVRQGTLAGRLKGVRLTRDGQNALVFLSDNRLTAVSLRTELHLMKLEKQGVLGPAALLPHRLRMVVGAPDGRLTWFEPGGELTDVSLAIPGGRTQTGLNSVEFAWATTPAAREIRSQTEHRDAVTAIIVSPSGALLGSGDALGKVQIWSANGRPMYSFSGGESAITSLAFTSQGRRLVGGDKEGMVRVWDYEQSRDIIQIRTQESPIRLLAASSDGSKVIVADGKTPKLWRVFEGRNQLSVAAHKGRVLSVQFAQQGRTLMTTGQDGTVAMWDTRSGKGIRRFRGHSKAAYGAFLDRNNTRLITAGLDRQIHIWDVGNGELMKSLGHPLRTLTTYVVGSDGRSLEKSDTRRGLTLRHLTLKGDSSPSRTLHSPDGRISASIDGDVVTIWDMIEELRVAVCTGHQGEIAVAQFSPDGRRLLTGGKDRTVKIWDPHSGVELLSLTGNRSAVSAVAFSEDGTQIASALEDGTAVIWQAREWGEE